MNDDRSEVPAPALVVMVGPPGTGKSHLVREVARRVPVAIVQTDAIRRGMVEHPEYTPEESRKVFFVAHRTTEGLLRKGRSVIFDATNIYEWGRRHLYEIAERAGARLLIVRTVAPDEVVEERLRGRLAAANPLDRSEAGWEIYLRMKAEFEEIQRPHLVFDTSRDRRDAIALAATRLGEAGWDVRIASPEPTALGDMLREEAALGLDVVVVAGGDGTLNLAIQSLACTEIALGVIPTGTGNVWARELGIPLDVKGATEVLLRGQTLRADLGRANGRYFLAIAGVGFDATVTRVLKPATKRRLGMMAYVVAAVVEAFKLRGSDAFIYANGRAMRRRILMVAVCNTRLYGGVLKMAPEAFVDDGRLDISVFYGRGFWAKIRHVAKTLLGVHRSDPEVEFFQTSRLRLESREYLPVQLDGDYFGTTPVEIEVVGKALRVIVPKGPRPQFRGLGVGC